MDYFVVLISGMIAAGLTYLTLDKRLCDKAKIFHLLSSGKDYEQIITISQTVKIVLTAGMLLLAGAAVAVLLHRIHDTINRVRLIIILEALIAAGWIDLRENRIPNIIPAFLSFAGLAFLGIEFLINGEGGQSYLVSCLLAFFVPGIVLYIVSSITHMGIGAGDIKLICSVGLIGGVNVLSGTVIFGTLFCAVVAVTLLITKKKSMKSTLPFGPFLMAGYILSLFAYQI